MRTSKIAFFTFLFFLAFAGCKKDHNPVEPAENEIPELVKTVVMPDIEAIKGNSRTPSGELDKVVTEVEGEQYAYLSPGTRQYLYDNSGRNIGFADQLSPKNSAPGFCDVIYEYKDDKIFRVYFTYRSVGYWGELMPGLGMREFIYDKSDRVTNVYVYYVDKNGVATRYDTDNFVLKYDSEDRLVELTSTGPITQKTIYTYSGKNLASGIYTYSESGKVSSEYRYEYKYDNQPNGLKSLPEIPKFFHPGPQFFDQFFGENNVVSLTISPTFYPTTTSGSETKVEYTNKFDGSGRLVEKIEDFKDGNPVVKKVYFYK